MQIGVAILCECLHPATYLSDVVGYVAIPANLSRQAALESNPLAVHIVFAFKFSPIPLDPGKRLNDYWRCCHLKHPTINWIYA